MKMMKKNVKRFPVYKNNKGKQNHWATMLGCESNERGTWDPIAQSLRVVLLWMYVSQWVGS